LRLLLDSHVLLWSISDPRQLATDVYAQVRDSTNEVFVSVATAWELAIKVGLRRLRIRGDLERTIDDSGFRKLGISFAHAMRAGALPRHHGDPFDRMLIAQAQSEGLTLVTRDRTFLAYGVPILKA
jgi:PIN domain nuclease of toxin-antitoxin system